MRPIRTVKRRGIRAFWMPQQKASALPKKYSSGDVFFVVTSDAGSRKDVFRAAFEIEAAFCSPIDSRKTLE